MKRFRILNFFGDFFLVVFAQYNFPSATNCCGANMQIIKEIPCNEHSCKNFRNPPKLCSYAISNHCDCAKGLYFNECIGKCVKSCDCPTSNELKQCIAAASSNPKKLPCECAAY